MFGMSIKNILHLHEKYDYFISCPMFFLFGLHPIVTLFLSPKQCSKICQNNKPQTGYSRRECFHYSSSCGSFKIRFTFKLLPYSVRPIFTLNFAYAVQTSYTLRSGRRKRKTNKRPFSSKFSHNI